MARSCESYDPSSSLETKDLSRRGVLAGLVGGAAGAAMLLAGCGKGDRIAVPPDYSTQSASPSESPSASPSPTETVDPKDLAEKRYEQVRKKYADITPEGFARLTDEERLLPCREELLLAEAWGIIHNPNNSLYNPSTGIKPGEFYGKPASPTDSPEEVAGKLFLPVVAAFDVGPWDPNFARYVASAAIYGNPELRISVLNDMLRNGKIPGPEYDGKKAIATLLAAKDEKEKLGYKHKVPGSNMFPILKPRFCSAKPVVDTKTGEALPTEGLQIFTEAETTGTILGMAWRVVIDNGLWRIVDNEVSDLKSTLD